MTSLFLVAVLAAAPLLVAWRKSQVYRSSWWKPVFSEFTMRDFGH
jgi:hypothetical protein